jgi:hypothetical protein
MRPRFRANSSAIPLSLAACAAEKKQLCSWFCMSSPSVSITREDDVEVNGISCGKIIKIEAPDFRLVMEGQI